MIICIHFLFLGLLGVYLVKQPDLHFSKFRSTHALYNGVDPLHTYFVFSSQLVMVVAVEVIPHLFIAVVQLHLVTLGT